MYTQTMYSMCYIMYQHKNVPFKTFLILTRRFFLANRIRRRSSLSALRQDLSSFTNNIPIDKSLVSSEKPKNVRSFSEKGLCPGSPVKKQFGTKSNPANHEQTYEAFKGSPPVWRQQNRQRFDSGGTNPEDLEVFGNGPPTPKSSRTAHSRSVSFRDNRRRRSWERKPDENLNHSRSVSNQHTPSHTPVSGRKSVPLNRRRSPNPENFVKRFRQSLKLANQRQSSVETPRRSRISVNENTKNSTNGSMSSRWSVQSSENPEDHKGSNPLSPVMIQGATVSALVGLCFKPNEETLSVTIEKLKVFDTEALGDFYVTLLHYLDSALMERSTTEVVKVRETEEASYFTCVEELFVLPNKFRNLKNAMIAVEFWRKEAKSGDDFSVGRILISSTANAVSKAHWSQFIHTVGFPATMWHTL